MNAQHLQAFAVHMKGNYTPAEKLARAAQMVRAMKRPREGKDMPFASKAQQRYMFKFHPRIAKRWADEYGIPDNLPEHAAKSTKAAAAQAALRSHKGRSGPK